MSKRIRTHYDNLKVSQDAPIEVIRAAYRSLCKKYHPDQNHDNPDADRIMSLINRSYAILSDPEQRRAHDEWIASQQHHGGMASEDRTFAAESENRAGQPFNMRPSETETEYPPQHTFKKRRMWLGLVFFLAVLAGLFWLADQQRQAASDMPAVRSGDAGASYPEFAQYWEGYPVLAENGNGMVKIDNADNRSPVFVQIYPADKKTAIRTLYIPPAADFTVFKLAAGAYTLRYRQLQTDDWEQAGFQVSDGPGQAEHVLLKPARIVTP
ncbi:MAG: J domain-containing protein [Neisseria zoodegmatis]|uniref:J domain-containing protein n=1 Tax=Neisseria zoodegmatis TaxID=326523 RepID=UPI0026F25167|nr:J domain-containing protein [Neisseria zoodegmatis]MDO5069627.1 J domain-containing protein [Neisseria zoodegmatis]